MYWTPHTTNLMFQLRKLKQRRLIAKNIVYRVALCNVLRPFCFLTCVSAGRYSESSAEDNVDRGTCTRWKRVWDGKTLRWKAILMFLTFQSDLLKYGKMKMSGFSRQVTQAPSFLSMYESNARSKTHAWSRRAIKLVPGPSHIDGWERASFHVISDFRARGLCSNFYQLTS